MTYCVGAINTATTFGPLSCGPGNAPTSSTSSSVSGGAISGVTVLDEFVIAQAGNSGNYDSYNDNYRELAGGAGVLVTDAATEALPAINYDWGRGSSAMNITSALAGYLKVEKIVD